MTDDNRFGLFFQLTKVDEQKRLVSGRATEESPDKTREIMDYASSKPNFQEWSTAAEKRSAGKSKGNIREMHSPIAAGKVTKIDFNDSDRAVDIETYCADDATWQKIMDGVLTGFSIGGTAKRFRDTSNPSYLRYTAYPEEISYVDSPAHPKAVFSLIKADGTVEERPIVGVGDFAPAPAAMADVENPPVPDVIVVEESATEPAPISEVAGFVSPNLIQSEAVAIPVPASPTVHTPALVVKVDEAASVLTAFTAAVQELAALKKAADDEKAAQTAKLKALGERVGIARKDGEPLTAPHGYPTEPSKYGDPANWSWPCDTKDRCQSALSYFNGGRGKDTYSLREWNVLGRRIASLSGDAFGTRYQYSPQKQEITEVKDTKKMAETPLTKDVGALMSQIHQALNVAVDQIGKDPAEAKSMLMALLGSLDNSVNPTPVNTSDSSPSAPTGGAQGDGMGKAHAVITGAAAGMPTTTAGATPTTMAQAAGSETTTSSTSTSSESPGSSSAPGASTSPTTTPADGMDKVNARIDQLSETVTKMADAVAILVKIQASPVTPVQKAIPAGDLAALLNPAPTAKDDPVIAALLSGDRYALRKAAEVAGSKDRPDYEAVNRRIDEAYKAMALPKFTRLMLSQGLLTSVPGLS